MICETPVVASFCQKIAKLLLPVSIVVVCNPWFEVTLNPSVGETSVFLSWFVLLRITDRFVTILFSSHFG